MSVIEISSPAKQISEMTDYEMVSAYQAGDRTNLVTERLCQEYRHIIRSGAISINVRSNHRFELEELIQVATEGFLRGIAKFVISKGYAVGTYTPYYIWERLSMFVQNQMSLATNKSTRVRQVVIQLSNITKEREIRGLNTDFSQADLELVAEQTKNSLKVVRQGVVLLRQQQATGRALVIELSENKDELATHECAFTDTNAIQCSDLVEELLSTLSERQTFILRNVVMADEPLNNRQAGERLGITEARVRQLKVDGMRAIAKECAARDLELTDLI
jgi:DNA-directed RNA polymerase specialized sigma subunit